MVLGTGPTGCEPDFRSGPLRLEISWILALIFTPTTEVFVMQIPKWAQVVSGECFY